jgi:P4 family phage/plasmid primase-like protien
MEYVWLATSLLDTNIETWPLFGDAVLDEIAAICHGRGEHFNALNNMVWLGVGGGGNTHDTCLAAVASLVGRGWSDSDISERIKRAKQLSVERAGGIYNWPQADQQINEWIVSAKAKGLGGTQGTGKRTPPERLMAEWALATLGNAKTINGVLRTYRDGHWPAVDIQKLLRSMYEFDSSLRRSEADNALTVLITLVDTPEFGRTPGLEPRDDPKRQRVCLLNGTLNLRTGELEEWSPDHELLHQVETTWDEEAECPLYDKAVKFVFKEDPISIETWDEYAALTLVDDMTFQKVLFLRGPGGNGKGTLARVLRNLHSPSAIGSVAVTDLNDERKRTSLVGKLVNISGEQSRFNTVADTYLKKITGGDPVDVRRLYGETQNNVNLSVRFIELVNEMPTTNDATIALRRRLLLLDCPNKVLVPDPDMDRKLLAERPGILRRFVQALHRLYQRGMFRMSVFSQHEIDAYLTENDPVAYWMAERLDHEPDPQLAASSNELWADFKTWSGDMGYQRLIPEVAWGRKLTNLGYASKVRTMPNGRSMRYRNLIIKPGLEGPI